MSVPIVRQTSQSHDIPKKIVINNQNQLPIDYSSTPGGTIYSTTPGGTRIVYERAFLMNLRDSPMSRTPPRNVPSIPTDLLKGTPAIISSDVNVCNKPSKDVPVIEETSEQFEMDM